VLAGGNGRLVDGFLFSAPDNIRMLDARIKVKGYGDRRAGGVVRPSTVIAFNPAGLCFYNRGALSNIWNVATVPETRISADG
jgi:hypothetical protein